MPVASAAASAAQTGQPKMKKAETAAKVDSAKIEPTERSMPPPSMTMVRPVTTMENSPSWRVDIDEGLRLEEAVDRGAEADDGDDEGQERDGIVRPALGQDLADQMIGDVVVAQALDAFP